MYSSQLGGSTNMERLPTGDVSTATMAEHNVCFVAGSCSADLDMLARALSLLRLRTGPEVSRNKENTRVMADQRPRAFLASGVLSGVRCSSQSPRDIAGSEQ